MRKKSISGVLALSFSALLGAASSAHAAEAASPHTFTGNMTLASEYLYRGIAQTRGKPALQGGFDYAHSSGLYAGVWASNVSWINDATAGASAGLEVDVYGGYKGNLTSDWSYDLGVLTYNYPGSGKPSGAARPDTTELYATLNWKWLTLKYSRSTGSLFGWTKTVGGGKTSGSDYLELNATYDMGSGWGLTGHVGHQRVNGRSSANYTDYKFGASKDVGFGSVGLAYSATNAKADCARAEDYCFVNTAGRTYDAGKGRVLLTFSKSF